MTTKSPTSTCGAYWGLCLPRRICAVWLASRPSTTSVASMTCQARSISAGLGEYVRTALVSSVVVGEGWWFRLTEHGRRSSTRGTSRLTRQPSTIPARATTRSSAPLQGPAASLRVVGGSGVLYLAQLSGLDVVDRAPHLARQQVGALADQPHGLPHVVVDVGEGPRGPRRTPARGLLHHVGERDVVGRLQP